MRIARPQLNALRRLVAALFALSYFWMATGGVAHHTDDMRLYASASSRVVLGHAIAALPAEDLCAACEWTSNLTSVPGIGAQLTLPLEKRDVLSAALCRPILIRPVFCAGDRAPPVLS
jgi:hypothetical protein